MILHLESDAYPAEALDQLRQIAPLVTAEAESQSDLIELLEEHSAHTLFVTLGIRIDGPVMDASPGLRWIVSPTTGLDHIDTSEAQRRGIQVISLRDAMDRIQTVSATAELTWGLLLSIARHITEADRAVSEGNWDRRRFLGTQLSGKTLGVIGFGRLGQMVANYGTAFGMRVLAHDVTHDDEALTRIGAEWVGVDDLLHQSDVITLHLPLNDSTEGWLSEDRISQLKPSAFVINTARGELIDEVALASALEDGRVGGIAVDVLARDATWESAAGSSPLLDARRRGAPVVVTPHIGGYADAAIATTRQLVVDLYKVLSLDAEGH